MSEISYYWDSLLGDAAAVAPYTADLWNSIWRTVLTSTSVNEGVIRNYMNDLNVFGFSGGSVFVDTGAAIVHGCPYKNILRKTLNLATPVSNPRVDSILLAKDWATRTIRIGVHQGAEAGSPVAPTLIQTDGLLWEMLLADVQIETNKSVAITNQQEYAVFPFADGIEFGQPMQLIESRSDLAGLSTFDFDSITQIYKHLRISGLVRSTDAGTGIDILQAFFNDDAVAANYSRQIMSKTLGSATVTSASNNAGIAAVGVIKNDNPIGYATQFTYDIYDYTGSNYTSFLQNEELAIGHSSEQNDISISREGGMWKDVSAITKITMSLAFANFLEGSKISLWGIRG